MVSGRQQDGADTKAISASTERGRGQGCLVVFFGIFLLFGCGFFYFMFLKPAIQIVQARRWSEVPCEIVSSKVEESRGDDGTTYRVAVRFRYQFEGRNYESDRYQFMKVFTGGRSGKQAIVGRLRPGTKTVSFVDPDDPSSAVIHRGFTPDMWFGLLPLLFIAIGGGGILFVSWFARKENDRPEPRDWQTTATALATNTTNPATLKNVRQAGPTTLKAQSSPGGVFIVAVVITLIWNGIVWIMAAEMLEKFQRGRPDWFFTLFTFAFVLIGIAMIGYVLYTLLALFNPRPTLIVNQATPQLGQELTTEWSLSGYKGSLRRLHIYLQGN